MADFWKNFERVWNESKVLAWILVLVAMGLVLFLSFCSQSPGVSIGLLALAAGLMSLRPNMHPAEKTAWAAILIAFTILEVVAIGRSDKANQNTWGGIATRIEKAATEIHTFHGEYETQIGHPPPPVVAKSNNAKPKPLAHVVMEITALRAEGSEPPPGIRTVKLWVTITNGPGASALVNNYGLSIKIPGGGEFEGRPISPAGDPNFVSLEADTDNNAIKPNGEVKGNLLFTVHGLPVRLDSSKDIQFVLSANVNGRPISITETEAEIALH